MNYAWVVPVTRVQRGPVVVGYTEADHAPPARVEDLHPINPDYPHPGGATHTHGAASRYGSPRTATSESNTRSRAPGSCTVVGRARRRLALRGSDERVSQPV